MAQVNLTETSEVDINADGVVIQTMLEDLPGGRTLDTSDITGNYLKAGHVVIREKTTGEYAALGISNDDYVAIGNYDYVGIVYISTPKDAPLASIMVRGTVNTKAATDVAGLPAYPNGIAANLSLIRFIEA